MFGSDTKRVRKELTSTMQLPFFVVNTRFGNILSLNSIYPLSRDDRGGNGKKKILAAPAGQKLNNSGQFDSQHGLSDI